MPEPWSLILGSAAVAAVVSGLINAAANYFIKRQELARQDMEMAFKMSELRHRQMVSIHDWTEGQAAINLHDPLMTAIGYLDGMKEYRKTGKWKKGDDGLQAAGYEAS